MPHGRSPLPSNQIKSQKDWIPWNGRRRNGLKKLTHSLTTIKNHHARRKVLMWNKRSLGRWVDPTPKISWKTLKSQYKTGQRTEKTQRQTYWNRIVSASTPKHQLLNSSGKYSSQTITLRPGTKTSQLPIKIKQLQNFLPQNLKNPVPTQTTTEKI